LAVQPDYPAALLQMGEVAYRREFYMQARAFLERYASAASDTAESLWLAYRVEVAMSDPVAARTYAKRLLRKFPESVEARLLIEEQQNEG
jgi:type IV pilus assembly protein PilF